MLMITRTIARHAVRKRRQRRQTRDSDRPRPQVRVSRRALLLLLGAGACCATADVAESNLGQIGSALTSGAAQFTEAQVRQFVDNAVNQERAHIVTQVVQIEGVALDAAIQLAQWAAAGNKYITVPLVTLLAGLGDNALQTLGDGVGQAEDALGHINVHFDWLSAFRATVDSWRVNLALLPAAIQQYGVTDFDNLTTYLTGLKQLVEDLQQSVSAATVPPSSDGQ